MCEFTDLAWEDWDSNNFYFFGAFNYRQTVGKVFFFDIASLAKTIVDPLTHTKKNNTQTQWEPKTHTVSHIWHTYYMATNRNIHTFFAGLYFSWQSTSQPCKRSLFLIRNQVANHQFGVSTRFCLFLYVGVGFLCIYERSISLDKSGYRWNGSNFVCIHGGWRLNPISTCLLAEI